MGRRITKPAATPEPIATPVSLFPATAVVVSASSSSTNADSSSSDTIPTATTAVPAQQSDSESESDADSDSPPKPVNQKPVATNPEIDSESESESESEPSPPKPKSAPPTKRSAEVDTNKVSSSVKRAKNDKSEPVVAVPISSMPMKKLFERVWSSEDELVILKGLYDYKAKKGIDPNANADDFVAFIKKQLHADCNKTQIMGKVRRLKKRVDTLNKRKKIGDPHDMKLLELSRKVWSVDGDEPVVAVEKTKKTGLSVDGDEPVVAEVKTKKTGSSGGDGEKAKRIANVKFVGEEKDGYESEDVVVDRELEFAFGDGSGTVLREAMKRFEGEEKNEMRMMVDKANVAYLDAYLLRLKVLEVAAKKILDGIHNDEC